VDWALSPLVQLGSLGVLISVLLWIGRQVYIGNLIPKAQYEALKAAQDEAIQRLSEENKEWKAAYLKAQSRADVQTEQIGVLLETARTQEAVMHAVKELSK
jgi:hypothetical protein